MFVTNDACALCGQLNSTLTKSLPIWQYQLILHILVQSSTNPWLCVYIELLASNSLTLNLDATLKVKSISQFIGNLVIVRYRCCILLLWMICLLLRRSLVSKHRLRLALVIILPHLSSEFIKAFKFIDFFFISCYCDFSTWTGRPFVIIMTLYTLLQVVS